MKDLLKEFIDQNRGEFDNRQPSNSAWGNIENSLPKARVVWWNSVTLWRAAAILLMGLSSYLLISPNKQGLQSTKQLTNEFKDLDTFYNTQITEKVELVSQFQLESGDLGDEVTQNLQKLEAMYQVLKLEMKNRPTQDVKDALVLNLLVRIDLLNQQLNKLDRRGVKETSKTV
jgi:hypothetical protein